MDDVFLIYLKEFVGEKTSDDHFSKKEDIDCLAEIIVNLLMKEYYEEQK